VYSDVKGKGKAVEEKPIEHEDEEMEDDEDEDEDMEGDEDDEDVSITTLPIHERRGLIFVGCGTGGWYGFVIRSELMGRYGGD
jgi:hypothetical protein